MEDELGQRLANLIRHRAAQQEALVKDHDKAKLASIIVAGRIAHAERDIVQRDLFEALKEAREWLLGWQSAAPYLETIERALTTAGWTPEADGLALASESTVPPIPGSGR